MPTSPSSAAPRTLTVALTPPQAVAATTVLLSEPAGGARDGRAVVVVAHGAGGGPDTADLRAVTASLVGAGHCVARFSFAYRLAGRRRPDPPARLLAVWRDVIAALRDEYGSRPLVLGGRSMGGRLASMVAAEGTDEVAGLVLLAYPLRSPPPGRSTASLPSSAAPRAGRTDHWAHLRVPVLFIAGDRDSLCDLTLLRHEVNERLRVPVELHVVEGADHSFRVRQRDGRTQREVHDELANVAACWVTALVAEAASA